MCGDIFNGEMISSESRFIFISFLTNFKAVVNYIIIAHYVVQIPSTLIHNFFLKLKILLFVLFFHSKICKHSMFVYEENRKKKFCC